MFRVRLAYKIIGGAILLATGLVFLLTGGQKIAPIFAGTNTSVNPYHPVVSFHFDSRATTVVAAFAQAGIAYHPQDQIQVFPANIQDGLGGVIFDTQALPLTIVDGTKPYAAFTWAATVDGLLKEQNITLGDQDEISPALASTLHPKQTITIVRVAVTSVTQTSPVAFNVVKQDDPTLNKGLTKVKTPGKNGVLTSVYRDTRKDGVTVSHVLQSQSVTTAPISEVDLIGTKPVITVPCAGYDNTVLSAAIANNVDPNLLCKGLIIESNGHAGSVGGGGTYYGLFQYTTSFWAQASAMCGFPGAAWNDGPTQIKVTACAIHKGYSSRWPWA
ncbi:MAG TPA: G5 domain-containing protein [Candidatus Saccharimonadales bacterium]|nr:G5 domain-containing protein [Candidatus Saccharimonadales bacterium]